MYGLLVWACAQNLYSNLCGRIWCIGLNWPIEGSIINRLHMFMTLLFCAVPLVCLSISRDHLFNRSTFLHVYTILSDQLLCFLCSWGQNVGHFTHMYDKFLLKELIQLVFRHYLSIYRFLEYL